MISGSFIYLVGTMIEINGEQDFSIFKCLAGFIDVFH